MLILDKFFLKYEAVGEGGGRGRGVVGVGESNWPSLPPGKTTLEKPRLIRVNRSLSDCNGTPTYNHFVRKRTLNHLANWPNDWAVFLVLICTVHLTVCCYHICTHFRVNSHSIFAWMSTGLQPTTTECGFTLKCVQQHTVKCTVQISTHNTTQSHGQFGQMLECSFTSYVVVGLTPVTVT